MPLAIHRPYPGVALVVTDDGSVLLGAPADAFKAVKAYCNTHKLAFPRVLVAPRHTLAHATPQFVPEFFLYDFLFVYGAAFKPDLASERMVLVVDSHREKGECDALRMTLLGPTAAELESYRDQQGRPAMSQADMTVLAAISGHMAVKRGGAVMQVEDMVRTVPFAADGSVSLFDGRLKLTRDVGNGITVSAGKQQEVVDLTVPADITPFNTLPTPSTPLLPLRFGIHSLGVRSGFDLTGPTTGFLFWVNGRGVLFDGPARTRTLLDSQGIAFADIDALILSHCHEDHMNSFVELTTTGHRPRVYTTEAIYRSALVKLANYFDSTPDEVAKLVDYHRVTPGEPVEIAGATFDFFYTVHPIPTLGVDVSLRDEAGQTHRIVVSGDTLHLDGLAKMRDAGVVPSEMADRLARLVPDEKVPRSLFFTDVGEALIHGHPKDWQKSANHVVYYHCPDNEHTRGFGHEIGTPGKVYTLVDGLPATALAPQRIVAALGEMSFFSPAFLAEGLFRGRLREIPAGGVLATTGEASGLRDTLTVIVAGTASSLVSDAATPATGQAHVLRPGDFFGVFESIDSGGRANATITAITPMVVIDLPGDLVDTAIAETGADDSVDRMRSVRPLLDGSALFSSLSIPDRSLLAKSGIEERYPAGEIIMHQGQMADDFFVLVQGDVELKRGERLVAQVAADSRDNFFGEQTAVYSSKAREITARAVTPARVVRIPGRELRKMFFTRNMALHQALARTMDERTRRAGT